ncbi:COG4705 family protein [Paraburkholderia xenovorans]
MNPSSPPAVKWLNKVPEITLVFWIIKMMSTTVGETAADYLSINLKLGLAGTSIIMACVLAGSLFFQIRAKRYVPALYWLCVVCISVFGTLVTDNLSDTFAVRLAVSTAAFGTALVIVFALWYATERTLSVQEIDTRGREYFYWAAILLTFALGTAAGDWVAEGMGTGYANAALLFGSMIVSIALARYVLKANTTLCFWLAYILTRPFGASCGDLLAQPVTNGGLGLGTTMTSIIFLATIVCLIACLSIYRYPFGEERV